MNNVNGRSQCYSCFCKPHDRQVTHACCAQLNRFPPSCLSCKFDDGVRASAMQHHEENPNEVLPAPAAEVYTGEAVRMEEQEVVSGTCSRTP